MTANDNTGMDVGGRYPDPLLIPHALRPVYRFFLGRPLDGHIYTDATFWHRARHGYPSRWLRLAGWQRAMTRMSLLYVAMVVTLVAVSSGVAKLCGVLGVSAPEWTRALSWDRVAMGHVLLVIMVTLPWVLYVRVRDYGMSVSVPVIEVRKVRRWYRVAVHLAGWVPWELQGRKAWELEKVRPVAVAAANVLSLTIRPEKATEWVSVPRTYQDPDGSPVEVLLPDKFAGADEGQKTRLVRTLANKLGLKDPIVSWQLEGSTPRVLVSAQPEPPTAVSFADVRDLVLMADEYRPFVGLTGRGAGYNAEMIEDSPHIVLSAGPGAGKSTLGKLIGCQQLHRGWGLVILDWKMTKAFDWAKGLPGVLYLSNIEDIHDFGVRIAEEIEDRKRKGMAGRAKVLVIRDEWNVTAELLMAYWQDLRSTADPEERKTMPVKSPALRGFAVLDFAGREFGAHDFVIAQRVSARVFNGNADIRECFGIRMIARYTEQTKKMLVGNMKPFPKKSNVPGRWTVVAGEEVVVVQVPLITNEEAREIALSGLQNPITPLSSSYYPGLMQPSDVDHGQGKVLNLDATQPLAASGMTATLELTRVDERKLMDMVEPLRHLGITHAILRNATQRPEEAFPLPHGGSPNRGYTYDFAAVTDWARRRHARLNAERETR